MATFSKIILSGSTDGKGIQVTGTSATAGTVIHTAVTGSAQSVDEIFLWAYNTATTDRTLSISWGSTGPGTEWNYCVTAETDGLHLVAPGLVLKNELVVKAYATVANAMHIFGYVNRSAS